jgi:hypothetical protein
MSVNVASGVPTGVYTITVDYSLTPEGGDCSGTCVQPTYALYVNPLGVTEPIVVVNLQDGVNVPDSNAPPANAPLSDLVSAVDKYVAPATALFSDSVSVVDRHTAPVITALSDIVGLLDQQTASPPPKVQVVELIIEAHSPVNILVISPSGGQAGFGVNGTTVNQLGANMTGPDSEPEAVVVPAPSVGYYQIIVYGKSSASANGSPYTITVESVGRNGTSLSEWSHTASTTPGSTGSLSFYLLSTGNVSTSLPTPSSANATKLLYAVLLLGLVGVLGVLLLSRMTVSRARTAQGA